MAASKRTIVIVAFAALYVIWGSTYLGIRFAIETIPPFLMAGALVLVRPDNCNACYASRPICKAPLIGKAERSRSPHVGPPAQQKSCFIPSSSEKRG